MSKQIESILAEPIVLTVEHISRIGFALDKDRPTVRDLIVHIPLVSKIISVQAFMRNAPWPDGSDMGNNDWTPANFDNSEVSIGWCRVGPLTRGTTTDSQFFTAQFLNWLTINPRFGRLVAIYQTVPAKPKGEMKEAEKSIIISPKNSTDGGGGEFPRGL